MLRGASLTGHILEVSPDLLNDTIFYFSPKLLEYESIHVRTVITFSHPCSPLPAADQAT